MLVHLGGRPEPGRGLERLLLRLLMKKFLLYIILPACLAFALAGILRKPGQEPAPDPERYIFHTPDQLDSLWMEEVGRGEE